MKKIIALAVAGAFVAPAFAADVTVGGSLKYDYISTDFTDIGDKVSTDDNNIYVSATQELDNGLSVSAKFTVVDDTTSGTEHQGTALTLSGEMGSISVGDNSGALDATGDYTDISPVFGGFDADGGDQAILVSLPTVNGVSIKASMSPNGDNYVNNEGNTDLDGDAEGREASALSLTYSMGPVTAYYGTQEADRAEAQSITTTAYGFKYSANGIYVAYEMGEADNVATSTTYAELDATDDLDYKGFAAKYTMSNLTVGVEMQSTKEKSEATSFKAIEDETVMFLEYDLGGAQVYVASRSSDSDYATTVNAQADQTAVGVKFAF